MPQLPLQQPLGVPFIELQSVDSTNNYALQQVHAGLASHGAAFFAHEQLAGKGQRGKSWTSGTDDSLILSLVIRPPIPLSRQFELSACIAVAVHELFTRYAGDATRIKWPNDIYWHDRKAGGILIETVVRPGSGETNSPVHWPYAIAGIGININQAAFAAGLGNAVSLRQITGKTHEPVALARELCVILDRHLETLSRQGFDSFYDLYSAVLYKRGERVRLRKDNRVFEALIKGISRTGKLVVQHALEEEFSFGEVSWTIGETG